MIEITDAGGDFSQLKTTFQMSRSEAYWNVCAFCPLQPLQCLKDEYKTTCVCCWLIRIFHQKSSKASKISLFCLKEQIFIFCEKSVHNLWKEANLKHQLKYHSLFQIFSAKKFSHVDPQATFLKRFLPISFTKERTRAQKARVILKDEWGKNYCEKTPGKVQ